MLRAATLARGAAPSRTLMASTARTTAAAAFAQAPRAASVAPFARVASRTAYSDTLIQHYENPRNVGSLDKSSKDVGTGLVGAPACGDVLKMQIKVDPATGVITEARFKAFGCGSAIAASSVASEMVKGLSVSQAQQLASEGLNAKIAQHLSLPPVKLHCSMLAEDAVKAAVKDWKEKNGDKAAEAPHPQQHA